MAKKTKTSEHTSIGYYLILMAAIIELTLGFTYIGSETESESLFGVLTMIEGFAALSGLLFIDVIYGKDFAFKPKIFKKLDSNTFLHALIIAVVLMLTQILTQIPLTIRDSYRAASIIFAAPAEEALFRGVIISIFIVLGQHSQLRLRISNKRDITIPEILGFLLSSTLFMFLHINYYDDPRMLMVAFVSGFVLAFFYWYWRDLTANILAHLLLNIIVVYQFYMVNL